MKRPVHPRPRQIGFASSDRPENTFPSPRKRNDRGKTVPKTRITAAGDRRGMADTNLSCSTVPEMEGRSNSRDSKEEVRPARNSLDENRPTDIRRRRNPDEKRWT